MKKDYKPLYISVAINFLVGAVIGIILFYGQVKNAGEEINVIMEYNKEATLSDFFRLSWENALWLVALFFARSILPVAFLHPIVALRGTVSSFSALYILTAFGVREMMVSLFPQCVSILPILAFFSVEAVLKYKNNVQNGHEPCSLRRYEVASMLVMSVVASAVEVLFFAFFCKYLF